LDVHGAILFKYTRIGTACPSFLATRSWSDVPQFAMPWSTSPPRSPPSSVIIVILLAIIAHLIFCPSSTAAAFPNASILPTLLFRVVWHTQKRDMSGNQAAQEPYPYSCHKTPSDVILSVVTILYFQYSKQKSHQAYHLIALHQPGLFINVSFQSQWTLFFSCPMKGYIHLRYRDFFWGHVDLTIGKNGLLFMIFMYTLMQR
jgi:hypothetical protein